MAAGLTAFFQLLGDELHMRDEVAALWREDVDVPAGKMGLADFENRDQSLTIWDSDGRFYGKVQALADHWGVGPSLATDRSVRIYLAHLIDAGEIDVERNECEIEVLIPPEGWVQQEVSPPLVADGTEPEETQKSWTHSIPPTVDELVDEAVDVGLFESRADVAKSAVQWLSGQSDCASRTTAVEEAR